MLELEQEEVRELVELEEARELVEPEVRAAQEVGPAVEVEGAASVQPSKVSSTR